jgi:hypothetical protein
MMRRGVIAEAVTRPWTRLLKRNVRAIPRRVQGPPTRVEQPLSGHVALSGRGNGKMTKKKVAEKEAETLDSKPP